MAWLERGALLSAAIERIGGSAKAMLLDNGSSYFSETVQQMFAFFSLVDSLPLSVPMHREEARTLASSLAIAMRARPDYMKDRIQMISGIDARFGLCVPDSELTDRQRDFLAQVREWRVRNEREVEAGLFRWVGYFEINECLVKNPFDQGGVSPAAWLRSLMSGLSCVLSSPDEIPFSEPDRRKAAAAIVSVSVLPESFWAGASVDLIKLATRANVTAQAGVRDFMYRARDLH